jgi:transketolase
MTAEAYNTAEELVKDGIEVLVVACPFLNRVNGAWFAEALKDVSLLVTIDNHYLNGGFGDQLLAALGREGNGFTARVLSLGLTDVPACGQPLEVLRHHGFDSATLTDRIRHELKK